jgi:hypothetical protein
MSLVRNSEWERLVSCYLYRNKLEYVARKMHMNMRIKVE